MSPEFWLRAGRSRGAEPPNTHPFRRDDDVHRVETLAALIDNGEQSLEHRPDIHLCVPPYYQTWHVKAMAHDQVAEALVFGHQHAALALAAATTAPSPEPRELSRTADTS